MSDYLANRAIDQLREERPDLTPAEIARLAGVTYKTAHRWVNHKSNAPAQRISVLFERLGLDPNAYGLERTHASTITTSQVEPVVPPSTLQREVQRLQRQMDLLIEYHRRGDDTAWLVSQPTP